MFKYLAILPLFFATACVTPSQAFGPVPVTAKIPNVPFNSLYPHLEVRNNTTQADFITITMNRMVMNPHLAPGEEPYVLTFKGTIFEGFTKTFHLFVTGYKEITDNATGVSKLVNAGTHCLTLTIQAGRQPEPWIIDALYGPNQQYTCKYLGPGQ